MRRLSQADTAGQTEKPHSLQVQRVKACKYCGLSGHSTLICYARPKNRILPSKKMKQIGKQGQKWLRVRAQWFKDHPAPHYACYLCGERLTPKETTLDHIQSRSRHPELRYDQSNLAPCCWRCNTWKGSRDLEELEGI